MRMESMENNVENHGSSRNVWWIVGISSGLIVVLALFALVALMFGLDTSGGMFQ